MANYSEVLPCGLTAERIKGEEDNYMKKNYFMCTDGTIKLQPGGWILSANYTKFAKQFREFETKPGDINVVTFPKSGTTWTQEIVWNLIHNPDLKNPLAKVSLDIKFPYTEGDIFTATTGAPRPGENDDIVKMFKKIYPNSKLEDGIVLKLSASLPSPRMFKNHLPLPLLSYNLLEHSKVIYVIRDPRDVITSLYHYVRLQVLWEFRGTLDEFIDDFINDRMPYCPYWNHVMEAWKKRDHPNVLLVYFEDLKADPFGEVKRIDQFLETKRTTDQLRNIVTFSSFSEMKERTADHPPTSYKKFFNKDLIEKEGGFFRKGIVGDWKNRFTEKQADKIHSWMKKNLPAFGDEFKYKI